MLWSVGLVASAYEGKEAKNDNFPELAVDYLNDGTRDAGVSEGTKVSLDTRDT
jgi:hypothetical protein